MKVVRVIHSPEWGMVELVFQDGSHLLVDFTDTMTNFESNGLTEEVYISDQQDREYYVQLDRPSPT